MNEISEHKFIGVHIFGEMYGIDSKYLNDCNILKEALEDGIKQSGATLCSMQEKSFSPSGATLLALLSESHASIQTYPEFNALFFDAFTCGQTCRPERIAEALIKALKPKTHKLHKKTRGDEDFTNPLDSEEVSLEAENLHDEITC